MVQECFSSLQVIGYMGADVEEISPAREALSI